MNGKSLKTLSSRELEAWDAMCIFSLAGPGCKGEMRVWDTGVREGVGCLPVEPTFSVACSFHGGLACGRVFFPLALVSLAKGDSSFREGVKWLAAVVSAGLYERLEDKGGITG